MGSKGKGGACNLPSTSEEDEGSNSKKRPVWKTFRIYSTEYTTSSNRDEKKMAYAKITFNVNATERKIRGLLIRELPQLRGKRFKFFTKDSAGKRYFCPCSLKCEGKDHSAEWNGRNIPRAAKSNRTVYVLIESTTVEETRSRRVQNDTLTNSVPSDSQLRGSVGQYSSNPLNQKEGRVPKYYQSVSCPDRSLSGLEHQENTSVPPLSAYHGNDLNQWPTQLTQPSQEQTVSETEYEKVKDGGGVTEEKDGEGEGRIDISDWEMQTDACNNDVASTSENVSPQTYLESGYDTFPSENNTCLPVNPANNVEEEELRNFFVNGSPLLITNFNRNALLSTPTDFMENCQEYRRPQAIIKKIVPKKGDVGGGETFYLSFIDACAAHGFQVQFGPSTIPVVRCSDKVFEGTVPSSSTDGVVEVYLVDYLLQKISNFVHFEYFDPKRAKEDFVEKDVKTPEDLQKMLELLCTKMIKMNSTSNDTKDAKGTNPPGGVKTQALSLFYMIVSTAAKLNALDFFRIIFSTQVGHSVFKSCKDAQAPLEEIARENGHEELARLLERKHFIYQDDENESDDEVDWKELARAIEKYQTLKGETAEKKSIPSTSSSEQIQGYLGDGESSTSLSSLHLLDVEGCTENTFEDQQTTQESMCGEEPSTCQSTAAEGCPESTFEEQQTTLESTCEEERDTCQIIVAEGCPENTLEDQQNIPKSRCREKPDTCQTSGKIAIRDGMSDTDIINKILSSYQLRVNKARHIKGSQSSIGEKNELTNLHVNPLHSVVSCPIIIKRYQMDKFAPKEVSSLRRKLGSFDAAKMNPSALYPDEDQAIYNLIGRLDTPPEVHFLEKLKQDSTGGLKAQKGCKNQKTAEKELCDTKRKGAAVIKTESITCLYSPLQSKVESGVEIAALAGSASNSSLEEQSTEEEISQDARFFDERSASNISLEEQSTEEEITQDARFFDERKSACLWFLKTRRLAYAVLLTSLLIVVVCLVTIFTSRASTKKQTPSTWVETMTTSRQACSNGLLTLSCEGVTNVNAVHKVRWKIKFPEAGWKEFSYCGRSGMNCVVTRPELPEGIKVLKVSNRSVNLQRVAKNNTNGYAQTMCQVLYSDNSRTSHVHKINFTAKCVRIHEHSDLNLTKILQSLVRCERAVDIEWYSIDGNKFAYCNTCQDCKKLSEVNREHVFWNRLQVTRDSLLLTAIQESDDGRTIKVKVHMEASGKSAGRDVEASMESAHMYTIWIFVNTSRPPVVNCSVLSVGHLVKTSPHSCVTSQMKFNTTCSFSCPHGYQLQGPSYKQCGANGQWTDNAKSVSCQDVNECTASNGGCSHKCVNTAGGYKCECPDPELSLASDNKTCHVVNCSVLNVGHLVKTSPDSCVTSQMKFNTTCSFSCPHGYQLQGPSYKQCGSNGQWTDSAKSVSCQDVNECTAANGGCSHKCVNTAGGYKCECPDPELSLASDNKTCHGVCPNSWIYLQGSCYKLFSEAESWNAANFACEALGAKLVVLNSLAENQAVGEKVTGGKGTYIGLYRSPKDKSRWLWLDQSRATFTHWYSGEPNNVWESENCVQMLSKSMRYEWNDLSCNNVYEIPYVCKTSVVNCSVLSVGHLVKTSPDSCVTSQMKFSTTCSFSCPHGYQLQGPSYKQCRTNGQWTDSAKSVSCQDVNECTASNGGCSHKCVNTAGGYKCECPDPELSLAPDNKTCHVPEKENKSLFGSPVKMAAVDDCQEMQYWNGTSCIPCSGCPRGFGLKTKCQSKRDTECVACYPGYDYSNTTGFELCIPCDRYSNCLPGRSKKIKECTIFSGPVCDGCEDGNYFNPTLGGCVKCSFPCSILQEEIRSCTTDHDRKCKAKRTVTPPGDSPTSPATEVPSAGLDWRVDLEPPLVQNGGLWGGVAGGFVLLVIAIAVTIIKSKSRNRRKRHATAENDGQLRNPLMLNLDQSISNLTIKGRRFITRRLNGKCYDGYFYWEICAHKLGYQTECESWKYAENPAEKFLTAYGEKAGSTIKKLVDVLRDPEVDLTQIADEIERELFLLSYEVDNVEETEI